METKLAIIVCLLFKEIAFHKHKKCNSKGKEIKPKSWLNVRLLHSITLKKMISAFWKSRIQRSNLPGSK